MCVCDVCVVQKRERESEREWVWEVWEEWVWEVWGELLSFICLILRDNIKDLY